MAKVRLLDPTDAKRRLDRYELIGELASGGMATVYLGRIGGAGGFQRFVAIKRLHPHLANEEEFIEMFLDEARLAAGIHNPYVVPILEVGQSDSGYYLVMEYIEGDTLARLMARSMAMAKPVPRPVLVRIVIDALAGLHAAHELVDPQGHPIQLVHRDVSPQNILVGVDGCSRITDFGVAHAASRLTNTRADKLKGKLAYMSPEQARAGDVDRRADVFAMGIILWEVLAQKRLFRADHEAITLQKVTVEPIPRLAQVAPGVHPAFDQVAAKALERDPNRRYRSAAEMAESLERAARTAASTSPTDVGVAAPREVSAYVLGALGDDIAAQRESVRAWLAHSEPSLPRLGGVKAGEALGLRAPAPDVTFKMPLDRPGAPGMPSSLAAPAVPAGARPRAEMPTQPELVAPAEMEPAEGVPDDDDEHETLLMDRDSANVAMAALGLVPSKAVPAAAPAAAAPGPAAPAPAPPWPAAPRRHAEEGTPSGSIEALAIPPPPPPNRTPQVVAVVVGLVIALAGVILWWELSSGQPPPTLTPDQPAPGAPGTVESAAPTGAAPAPAKPAETGPAPGATATATGTAISVSGLPGKPVLGKPWPKGRGPKGALTPPLDVATAAPAARPAPPAPPAEDPELSNPYHPPR